MEKIDLIIEKILKLRNEVPGTISELTRDELELLCTMVLPIYRDQPIVLELKAPMTIVGDIHGQLQDLIRIFDLAKYPPETNYLFLGDYVDRGKHSIETICLLFAYKIKYPDRFYMLRGNHECEYINRLYGFYDECNMTFDTAIWKKFSEVFKYLPIAAIVEEKIFCIHGGISPDLATPDDIKSIQRPLEIPEEGLLCDLVWSDPNPDVDTWEENERGTSYCFGLQQVDDFLDRNGFDLICRAHQAVMGGYEFSFPGSQSMITLFSAPNYCYEYDNKGAILNVNKDLICSFSVLDPISIEEEFQPDKRPGTPPRMSSGNQPTEITVSGDL